MNKDKNKNNNEEQKKPAPKPPLPGPKEPSKRREIFDLDTKKQTKNKCKQPN